MATTSKKIGRPGGARDRKCSGNFKPLTLIGTGLKRPDLVNRSEPDGKVCRAGFNRELAVTDLPPDVVGLRGWAINLQTQQAWPLASSVQLPDRTCSCSSLTSSNQTDAHFVTGGNCTQSISC
jgi:hypothetical protein